MPPRRTTRRYGRRAQRIMSAVRKAANRYGPTALRIGRRFVSGSVRRAANRYGPYALMAARAAMTL